ncbi:MAG: QueT transporter family protein [Acidaminococcaceae bacterium]
MFNKEFTKTRKLTVSALCIALYVAVMMCTQSFAFGQYQIRIATALYALSAMFPFLVVPFGIANFISNSIMGGLGPLDMIGGALVGVATSAAIVWLKDKKMPNYFIAVVITLIPGLVVPIWLSVLLDIPYWGLVSSIILGQLVSGIIGAALVTALEKNEILTEAIDKR